MQGLHSVQMYVHDVMYVYISTIHNNIMLMYIHRILQLEKWTDEHDVTHICQSWQDQEICYDNEPWSNMYIGMCIMRTESDRKLLA